MEIRKYTTGNGITPFENWMEELRDARAKAKIIVRLDRIMLGNFGDHKAIGDGVSELRIDTGKGYRVYYGMDGNTVVLLLCGGNKATQQADIEKAKKFWRDYND